MGSATRLCEAKLGGIGHNPTRDSLLHERFNLTARGRFGPLLPHRFTHHNGRSFRTEKTEEH
jgi:hypothetical protein